MSHLGYHIRIHLRDGRVIAPRRFQRHAVLRTVLEKTRRRHLLTTSLADTHLHLLALCDRLHAGRLAQVIESSLRQRLHLGVSFEQYPPEPIRDAAHLRNAFRYILTQHRRHGLDPIRVFEGSNAPDLLGMRILGRHTLATVRQWLPRITRSDILAWFGLQILPGVPERLGSPPRLDHLQVDLVDSLELLEAATLAAAGLDRLCGSTRPVLAARRAMLALLPPGLTEQHAAHLLRTSPSAVRRLRNRPLDASLVAAVHLQVAYRRLARQPSRPTDGAIALPSSPIPFASP